MALTYQVMTTFRYFFEGFFCYLIFKKKSDSSNTIKINSIKKILIFLFVYVVLVTIYRYRSFLVPEKFDSTVRIFSTFIIYAYFFFENKIKKIKKPNINYILSFSIFISLITEISFQSCYLLNRIILWTFGITNTMMNLNFELYTSIDIALHLISMLLIYSTKFINPQVIKDLSTLKSVPFSFGIFLLLIIYLKYQFHHSLFGSEVGNSLLIGLMFVIFISFVSYWNLLELTKLKNIEDNRYEENKLNTALRDAKSKNDLCFNEKIHKSEMEYFKNVLQKIGMKETDKRFTQLAFAAVLLKHHKNIDEADLTIDIFSYIGKILNIQPKSVHANFRNALNKHWLIEDLDILEKNYKGPISENSGAPTPKEFLIYIVKKAMNNETKIIKAIN